MKDVKNRGYFLTYLLIGFFFTWIKQREKNSYIILLVGLCVCVSSGVFFHQFVKTQELYTTTLPGFFSYQ
jgi:hypothetical protein